MDITGSCKKFVCREGDKVRLVNLYLPLACVQESQKCTFVLRLQSVIVDTIAS